jgi:hypothetical protein
MNIPIIASPHVFGLKDEKDLIFLPLSMASVKLSNPDTRIIFPNLNNSILNIAGIEEIKLSASQIEGINQLRNSYLHLSTNTAAFELFCIERFFILRHVAKSFNIAEFFTFESDCLIFKSFDCSREYLDLNSKTPALTNLQCISTAYLTLEFLELFCESVLRAYGDSSVLKYMKEWYQQYTQGGRKGGISDMTFCKAMSTGWLNFPKININEFCQLYLSKDGTYRSFDTFLFTDAIPGDDRKIVMQESLLNGAIAKKLSYDQSGVSIGLDDASRVYLNSVHAQGNCKKDIGVIFSNYLVGISC